MNTHQTKSRALLQAMGWRTANTDARLVDWSGKPITDIAEQHPDLYDPAHMQLAWSVINWITSAPLQRYKIGLQPVGFVFMEWWIHYVEHQGFAEDAADFIESVLDQVWELLCEAGFPIEAAVM